jgi:hypothetical protein
VLIVDCRDTAVALDERDRKGDARFLVPRAGDEADGFFFISVPAIYTGDPAARNYDLL